MGIKLVLLAGLVPCPLRYNTTVDLQKGLHINSPELCMHVTLNVPLFVYSDVWMNRRLQIIVIVGV